MCLKRLLQFLFLFSTLFFSTVNANTVALKIAVFDNFTETYIPNCKIIISNTTYFKQTILFSHSDTVVNAEILPNSIYNLKVVSNGYQIEKGIFETTTDDIFIGVGLKKLHSVSLELVLKEENSKLPLPYTSVQLSNKTTGNKQSITSNEQGVAKFRIAPNNQFNIEAWNTQLSHCEEYRLNPSEFDTYDYDTDAIYNLDLYLIKFIDCEKQKQTLYFSELQSNLTQQGLLELRNLLITLKENNTLIIEFSGYADANREDFDAFNLSKARVETVKEYLLLNGINAYQIKTQWYGNNKLVNDCDSNNEFCTDKQHAANRRVEYAIINF